MRVMSIIGIILFSLALLGMLEQVDSDWEAAAGFGFLGLLYAIPYSIVGLIEANKNRIKRDNYLDELIKLNELKDRGIISESEFNLKKEVLLNH